MRYLTHMLPVLCIDSVFVFGPCHLNISKKRFQLWLRHEISGHGNVRTRISSSCVGFGPLIMEVASDLTSFSSFYNCTKNKNFVWPLQLVICSKKWRAESQASGYKGVVTTQMLLSVVIFFNWLLSWLHEIIVSTDSVFSSYLNGKLINFFTAMWAGKY